MIDWTLIPMSAVIFKIGEREVIKVDGWQCPTCLYVLGIERDPIERDMLRLEVCPEKWGHDK